MASTAPDGPSLNERISARLAKMSRAERQVAEYLRNHSREVIFATADQIGAASRTSDATVIRTAKSLGYTGLLELRFSLAQEIVHSTPVQAGDPGSPLAHVVTEAIERLSDTLRLTDEDDFTKAVDAVANADQVLAYGIGPSELVAEYLALRLRRMGRRARATGATGFRFADDLLELSEGDTVVLYTPSRLLADLEVLIERADEVGATTVMVTDSLRPLFGDRVHVVLTSVYSPGSLIAENVTSQVLTDALLLAVRRRDEKRVMMAAEVLTNLRSKLIQADSRDYVSRRDRQTRKEPS